MASYSGVLDYTLVLSYCLWQSIVYPKVKSALLKECEKVQTFGIIITVFPTKGEGGQLPFHDRIYRTRNILKYLYHEPGNILRAS